jgi:uncharacterized protein YndB with AHSA1/START domain
MDAAPAASLSLTIRRTYPRPRAEIFRAWTDPQELMKWWAPPGHDSPSADIDLRVGGRYRLAIRKLPGGTPFYVSGVYREIVIPERLVFTWNWEGGPPSGSGTLVTVEFHNTADGTELVLSHERFDTEASRDAHAQGWQGVLDKLSATSPH